ncbi:MAG: hypothetical protein ACI8WB_004538, partial [Phenylobacterium sp.]
WIDLNADGVSSSDEMRSFQSIGITHLDIRSKENNRVDDAGNWLPMWSWVTAGNKKYKMIDVCFKSL